MKHISLEGIWNKHHKTAIGLLIFAMLVSLTACGKNETSREPGSATSVAESTEDPTSVQNAKSNIEQESEPAHDSDEEIDRLPEANAQEDAAMVLTINEEPVSVEWEDNESVTALKELISDKPLTIQLSMYGGFEQVGSIGSSLPRNDVQTTTAAGDIVLYSGNQIVVFYGSNSWAYTRLGHITDKTSKEMADLLGNGDATITLSME